MSAKTEYRMVIEPPPYAREAGYRTVHYQYSKPSYEKARKAVLDFLEQREAGRFEKTWTQHALVYIEFREVSKWTKIDMDVDVSSESTTSRPAT